ncbi:hypothetical protein CHELA1G11_11270 [Hyphomicrobiales bacterium]|nr:hypothetical protein CHELA1G11_11270 [Hyphomicrobiales bacterium]CAH1668942.1 hypothetical protein CHELA1G2_13039 [Hyphomicrobiales bacterium]
MPDPRLCFGADAHAAVAKTLLAAKPARKLLDVQAVRAAHPDRIDSRAVAAQRAAHGKRNARLSELAQSHRGYVFHFCTVSAAHGRLSAQSH